MNVPAPGSLFQTSNPSKGIAMSAALRLVGDQSELTRVQQIIEDEAAADQLDKAIAEQTAERDMRRWRAAENIAAELADGKTQRQLAEEIGKDHRHVGRMAQVWREFGDHGPQERSFDSYYQEVKRGKPKPDPQASASEENTPEPALPKPAEKKDPPTGDIGGEGCRVTDPFVWCVVMMNRVLKDFDRSLAVDRGARNKTKKLCRAVLRLIEDLEEEEKNQ